MSGRVAVVTGAGQGLGESIAHRLAQDGHTVVVADIAAHNAQRVAAELPSALALEIDVREKSSLAEMFETVVETFGRVDVLINNAAVTPVTSIWEIEQEEWDDVLDVNLRGVFFGCQLAGPLMRDQGWGRIVNLASLAGQQGGLVAGAHYAASKAGIIVLTKIFARELAPASVTVNAVAPAAIDGPAMASLPEQRRREVAAAVPVQRVGRPEEVAALVAYLCSDEAAYTTGATVDINGGINMR